MVNGKAGDKPRKPLRRTPISSSKPLQRGARMRAKQQWLPPRSAIKNRSDRQAKLYREKRVPLVVSMLTPPQPCELGPSFRRVEPGYTGCTGTATTLHELRKRSQGGSILNPDNVWRSCAICNGHVEDEPLLAHAAGLVVRRGDPGWAELGAIHDAGAFLAALAIYVLLVSAAIAAVLVAYYNPRGW